MSYPEWGVGNFGDNPFFIQQMHDWFVKNQDNIAYAAYFDVDGLWPTQIDNGQFPNSQRAVPKAVQPLICDRVRSVRVNPVH